MRKQGSDVERRFCQPDVHNMVSDILDYGASSATSPFERWLYQRTTALLSKLGGKILYQDVAYCN